MPFREILFPIDFSERSREAAPFVLSLALRYNANITLLHVVEPVPAAYAGMDTVFTEVIDLPETNNILRQRLMDFAAAEFPKARVSCLVELGSPAETIVEFAATRNIDLIALPTHGYSSFRRLLLGSVTAKVLHDCRIPVWTLTHAAEPGHTAHPQPRHIICAIDVKSQCRGALEMAQALGEEMGARLEILHVAPEGAESFPSGNRDLEAVVAAISDGGAARTAAAGGGIEIVEKAHVADVVREMALRHRSDLVVIGRSSGFKPAGFGSDAYQIIREAPCPVLSV